MTHLYQKQDPSPMLLLVTKINKIIFKPDAKQQSSFIPYILTQIN